MLHAFAPTRIPCLPLQTRIRADEESTATSFPPRSCGQGLPRAHRTSMRLISTTAGMIVRGKCSTVIPTKPYYYTAHASRHHGVRAPTSKFSSTGQPERRANRTAGRPSVFKIKRAPPQESTDSSYRASTPKHTFRYTKLLVVTIPKPRASGRSKTTPTSRPPSSSRHPCAYSGYATDGTARALWCGSSDFLPNVRPGPARGRPQAAGPEKKHCELHGNK